MSLRFRADDFPHTKPEESWRLNVDSFKTFDGVMVDSGLVSQDSPYVLGVIPRHVKPEDLAYLGTLPHVEVAMHGINHDERFPNEFRDHLTGKDVTDMLVSVKSSWDPVVGPVTAYIPPHNVVDRRTVKALRDAGFKDLFGGPGSDLDVLDFAAEDVGMDVHYSPEFTLYGRSDELLERNVCLPFLQSCREGGFQDPVGNDVFLTLHFSWEMNIGPGHLREFLKKVKEVIS